MDEHACAYFETDIKHHNAIYDPPIDREIESSHCVCVLDVHIANVYNVKKDAQCMHTHRH